MKIINKNGRYFGIINVIDFWVIFLFLLCLIPSFYYFHKIIKQQHIVSGRVEAVQHVTMDIDCLLIKLKPSVARMISVGDSEFATNGELRGRIIHLGEIKPYQYQFDIGREGRNYIFNSKIFMQRPAILRVIAEVKNSKLYYKLDEIKYGCPIVFISDKYEIEGICLSGEIYNLEEYLN